MGRRSSVKEFASAKGGRNPVEQLNMLRDFVSGAGSWTETELTDCLKQCGYNVQRAAERLMTRQYQPSKGRRTNGKSAYFSLVASSPVKKKAPSISTNMAVNKQAKIAAKPPPSSVQRAPKDPPSVPSTASKQAKIALPKVTPKTPVEDLTNNDSGSWLLCQRWIADAICTFKNGRLT